MKQIIPRSNSCFCCGTDNPIGLHLTYYFEENKVFTDFIPDKNYGVSEYILNPGVAFGVLAEVMGWVPAYILRHPTVLVESNVRVLKAAPIGRKLIVIAEAISVNKWVSEVEGVLKDEEDNIYYKAKCKYVPISSNDIIVSDHFITDKEFCLPD